MRVVVTGKSLAASGHDLVQPGGDGASPGHPRRVSPRGQVPCAALQCLLHVRITPLASGSQGNCLLVQSGSTRLLVDLGVSAFEAEQRLALVGVRPEQLSGIVVTHRHGDHVAGLGVFARTHRVPIHCTRRTSRSLGTELRKLLRIFEPEQRFQVGSVQVHPVRLVHDAPDTVGFCIDDGHTRFGHATDLGSLGGGITQAFRHCQVLLLEFNHDAAMLREGPYPWQLKQRIARSTGHLSNEQGEALLRQLTHPGLEHVFLAHLSRFNNTPELALAAAQRALGGHTCRLQIARQDEPSEPVARGA
jgi:phosphoribosyl 1,2-cyclic phosphodiesterase